jgi:hypothetical protein
MKGAKIMHPLDHYETLRLGREALLRQAERERLARQVAFRQVSLGHTGQHFAGWLGMRLMRWGIRLVRLSSAQGV